MVAIRQMHYFVRNHDTINYFARPSRAHRPNESKLHLTRNYLYAGDLFFSSPRRRRRRPPPSDSFFPRAIFTRSLLSRIDAARFFTIKWQIAAAGMPIPSVISLSKLDKSAISMFIYIFSRRALDSARLSREGSTNVMRHRYRRGLAVSTVDI